MKASLVAKSGCCGGETAARLVRVARSLVHMSEEMLAPSS